MSRRGAGYGAGSSSGVGTRVGEGVEEALRKLGEGGEGGELVQLVSRTWRRLCACRPVTDNGIEN